MWNADTLNRERFLNEVEAFFYPQVADYNAFRRIKRPAGARLRDLSTGGYIKERFGEAAYEHYKTLKKSTEDATAPWLKRGAWGRLKAEIQGLAALEPAYMAYLNASEWAAETIRFSIRARLQDLLEGTSVHQLCHDDAAFDEWLQTLTHRGGERDALLRLTLAAQTFGKSARLREAAPGRVICNRCAHIIRLGAMIAAEQENTNAFANFLHLSEQSFLDMEVATLSRPEQEVSLKLLQERVFARMSTEDSNYAAELCRDVSTFGERVGLWGKKGGAAFGGEGRWNQSLSYSNFRRVIHYEICEHLKTWMFMTSLPIEPNNAREDAFNASTSVANSWLSGSYIPLILTQRRELILEDASCSVTAALACLHEKLNDANSCKDFLSGSLMKMQSRSARARRAAVVDWYSVCAKLFEVTGYGARASQAYDCIAAVHKNGKNKVELAKVQEEKRAMEDRPSRAVYGVRPDDLIQLKSAVENQTLVKLLT